MAQLVRNGLLVVADDSAPVRQLVQPGQDEQEAERETGETGE